MFAKSKACFFIAVFTVLMAAYLLLPMYSFGGRIAAVLDVFENPVANFIFMLSFFVFVAFATTVLFHFCCCAARGYKTDQLPIGDILVSEGFVKLEDLRAALQDQSRRLGEILVESGRITVEQRDHALRLQKKSKERIGEKLEQLGYATQKDVEWAIKQMGRRIGQILIDKKALSDYDLTCAMSFKKCIKDAKGNIVVIK